MDDELERPPSLWPWIIGGIIALFVIGAVIGSIVHVLFEVVLYGAVLALIAWVVWRIVGGRRR